jgi:ATP-dependent 26S proteasome regulatory subunit
MKPAFLDHLEDAFNSRQHAIITLNTEDRFFSLDEKIPPCNLNYFLATYFVRQGYGVVQYTPSMGIKELSPSGTPSPVIQNLQNLTSPAEIFNGLRRLLTDEHRKWIVLIMYAERVAPANELAATSQAYGETLHSLAMDDNISRGQSRMILVTYTGMPEALIAQSRVFRTVEASLPSLQERSDFITVFESQLAMSTEFGQRDQKLHQDELARLTAGMSFVGIENLYRSAARSGEPINVEHVRLAKVRDIRKLARDLLEVSEPLDGFDMVAGQHSVKAYFRTLVRLLHQGTPGVPQAFLLQGVPGCGKSHVVRALACELGWPLLELRNVMNPYVGQSEMNLDHVIRVVEQLAPAILFFDEIDQTLGQRGTGQSGDSGTSERMLARMFSWLGALHLRGRLLFIGATNRPDLLDPAMLDRFAVNIPFLKPGHDDLEEFIPLVLRRFELHLEGITVPEARDMLAPLQPTGRDIQDIIVSAGMMADRHAGGAFLTRRQLQAAVDDYLPREDNTEMQFIALTALKMCNRQSLLPWNGPEGLRDQAAIPTFLLERGVVRSDGRLDSEQLSLEINKVMTRRMQNKSFR